MLGKPDPVALAAVADLAAHGAGGGNAGALSGVTHVSSPLRGSISVSASDALGGGGGGTS